MSLNDFGIQNVKDIPRMKEAIRKFQEEKKDVEYAKNNPHWDDSQKMEWLMHNGGEGNLEEFDEWIKYLNDHIKELEERIS